MSSTSLRHTLRLALALALSGCGGTDGPIFDSDSGTDAGPLPDAGHDAGDLEAPAVIDTTPDNGAIGVAPSAPIVIVFSEAMSPDGTITLTVDGEPVTASRTWSGGDSELSLSAALPLGARVSVVVERDFTDLAGNPLAAPHVFEFLTGDDVAPFVTGATPPEGATASARTSEIRIDFSEPMDASVGALALEGGPGTLGEITWVLGGLVVPVTGLAYDTSYRVVLTGFADPSGNALEGEPYLGDGALDFTTGPDTDPPRVVDASPSEGQVDVPDTTATVTVRFDEAMDTSVTTATLTVGTSTVTVTGTWSTDGTEITFDVSGLLARNAAHSLSLAGYADAAGNALDPVPHVGDGALDFVTGVDIFAPYVGFTNPIEGGTGVSFRQSEIVVVFSEAMDTSRTTVQVSDGTTSFTATGTWSLSGTRFTIDVAGQLYAARSYAIDFTAFTDAGGTLLDAAHAYLGDGILEFTLGPPTGENCQDALTVAEGTLSGGVYEWVLAPGAVTVNDGSNTCRGGGTPTVDALIRYTKTTPSASSGGAALRIYVESGATIGNEWMAVAVLSGECDPTVVDLGPQRLRCVSTDNPQHVYLDVGPGEYFVWVSHFNGSDFRGATVRLEEVAAPPEGESCVAPYTTSTASTIYTPPATADDSHRWDIPYDAVQAMDHAVAYNGPGAMECDRTTSGGPDTNVGNDAVVELPKTSATSVGWLHVEAVHTYDLTVQLLDRCDATDPAATSLACQETLRIVSGTPRTLETTFDGPAGSRYLWLANDVAYNDFPGAIVRYREIEPQPGDTCATAIPITVGATNAVTPNRPHRLPAPSCFAGTDSVTWYRFTSPERFTHVTADGDAAIAAILPADGAELRCQASAASQPLVTFLPPGSDVCVAVASGTAVTSLTVESLPYSGNLGVETNLNIGRPLNASGSERPLTAQTWLAATPTTLYQGVGTQGVLLAPLAGGVVADFRDDVTTILGSDAITVGEALFILDDTSTATAARVHRLAGSDGSWLPTAWDTGSAYPGIRMDAITYDGTSLIYATDWSTTNPTRFYSLSPTSPGAATLLGSTNLVRDVSGIAADGTYLYVVGRTDATAATEGVFRIPRSDLGAAPERLATVDVNIARASIELDSLTAPQYLYFRDDSGNVHVISGPAGTSPRHLGIIASPGPATSETMTIDRATGALYVFVHTSTSDQRFLRLD